MSKVAPVAWRAWPESKKATMLATSSGGAASPIGTSSSKNSLPGASSLGRTRPVSTQPGATV